MWVKVNGYSSKWIFMFSYYKFAQYVVNPIIEVLSWLDLVSRVNELIYLLQMVFNCYLI